MYMNELNYRLVIIDFKSLTSVIPSNPKPGQNDESTKHIMIHCTIKLQIGMIEDNTTAEFKESLC